MQKTNIVLVEDEEILRVSLADDIQENDYKVFDFGNPLKALDFIKNNEVDIVITDIKMPLMTGLELLERIKAVRPNIFVIIMTAFSSVDSAIEAMKKGAYDYIAKPFKIEEMLLRLGKIKEFRKAKEETTRLRFEKSSKFPLSAYVGKSSLINETFDLVKTILDKPITTLITGETGTGKELLANILHYNSNRRDKPFIKVSCAILSREVFESELFGHEKGAYTGAIKSRKGRFEMADEGTLYLDDIDDVPLEMQVKLLRVLQEQEIERVGGNQTIKIDVRVIASTKADLRKLVQEGKFREDLFFRLNVFPINIAPLRQRKEDIALLIEHFSKILAPERNIIFKQDVIECLERYDWKGNIRELKNIVERMILLTENSEVDLTKVPKELFQINALDLERGELSLDEMLSKIEKKMIFQALKFTNRNQVKAAEKLGIPPSTLRTKMAKYKITSETEIHD